MLRTRRRMRVLFCFFPEIGHVNPFIGTCQRLGRAGHTLGIQCPRSFAAQFERAGIQATWFCDAAAPKAQDPRARVTRLTNPRWLDIWYQVAVRDGLALEATAKIETIFDAFSPDVACVDPLRLDAVSVLARRGTPWTAVSTNLLPVRPRGFTNPFLEAGLRSRPLVEAAFEGLGLTIEGLDVVSPWHNAVLTTEALIPRADTDNHHSTFVGPARADGVRGDAPEFPFELLDDRPLVYVSGGGGHSVSFEAEPLLRIARSLEDREAQFVIAAPALVDDAALKAALPANAVLVGYAPQEALLERAAVFVTHGGANGFNEALTRGTPMLVLPLALEQPLQAVLAERSGVGRALDIAQAREAEYAAALRALLEDGEHRRCAERVRTSYAATDSAGSIAQAIEGAGTAAAH
jgi:zeaxanthin glucosyltransferase